MRILISIFSILPIIILFYPLFSDQIILGGEGLFTLNYSSFFNKFFSFWFSDGFGHPNVLYNFIGLPHFIFLILKIFYRYKNHQFYLFCNFNNLTFFRIFLLSFQITKSLFYLLLYLLSIL